MSPVGFDTGTPRIVSHHSTNWAQLVERWLTMRDVSGSNPIRGIVFFGDKICSTLTYTKPHSCRPWYYQTCFVKLLVKYVTTKLYAKRHDFNFPIVNFPFICSNSPAAHAYGVYISQFIRYSRACDSYQDFLDIGSANKEATEPRVPLGIFKLFSQDMHFELSHLKMISCCRCNLRCQVSEQNTDEQAYNYPDINTGHICLLIGHEVLVMTSFYWTPCHQYRQIWTFQY
jgi:hypothetical protein